MRILSSASTQSRVESLRRSTCTPRRSNVNAVFVALRVSDARAVASIRGDCQRRFPACHSVVQMQHYLARRPRRHRQRLTGLFTNMTPEPKRIVPHPNSFRYFKHRVPTDSREQKSQRLSIRLEPSGLAISVSCSSVVSSRLICRASRVSANIDDRVILTCSSVRLSLQHGIGYMLHNCCCCRSCVCC